MQPRKKHFCSGNKSQANVFAGQGKKDSSRSNTVGSNLGKSAIWGSRTVRSPHSMGKMFFKKVNFCTTQLCLQTKNHVV